MNRSVSPSTKALPSSTASYQLAMIEKLLKSLATSGIFFAHQMLYTERKVL